MKQRGRKSREALSVVPIDCAAVRPDPPTHLTADERELWNAIVWSMRGGWFDAGTVILLELYVQNASLGQMLSRQIEACGMEDLDRLEALTAMRARTTATLCSLATKMRLTQQSSRQAGQPKYSGYVGPRPWRTLDEEFPPPPWEKTDGSTTD